MPPTMKRVGTGVSRMSHPAGIISELKELILDEEIKGGWAKLKRAAALVFRGMRRHIKVSFTSFLGIHVAYITLWAIVVSVILYPNKNISYTDALFMATSAVTQTGLNSVNVSDLALYQQIFLFVTPIFTHPLLINWALVFYRLRLFESKFEDIDKTSKFQSRLRRAATMARFESRGRYRSSGRSDPPDPAHFQLGLQHAPSQAISDSSTDYHRTQEHTSSVENSVDSKAGEKIRPITTDSPGSDGNVDDDAEDGPQIRFGALPRPPDNDRRNQNFDAQEMYRSLNMMQTQHPEVDMDEDDGPPLVIKSPRDIEADEARGIHAPVFETGRMSNVHSDLENGENANTGGFAQETLRRFDTGSNLSQRSQRSQRSHQMTANYLSWTPTIARNSAFVDLTAEQKEELGGVEYRALKVLRWFIPIYFFVVITVSVVMAVPWIYERKHYRDIVEGMDQNPGWFAMSILLSSFCNCGFSMLPDSMSSFRTTAYLPLLVTFNMMAGNCFLPIFFRVMLWFSFKCAPTYGRIRESLGFLLDHPRRCTMMIFPRNTTLWLIIVFLILMISEIALFMILNCGDHSPYPDLKAGPRLLLAYFQSISVRTSGLAIITISSQHPAVLVWNVVMMYVAIYPVAMAIRKTNVYDEQTLGVYYAMSAEEEEDPDGIFNNSDGSSSPLVMHIRRQLGMDLWGMALALVLLAITEGGPISRNDFSLFDVIYEMVSAYGTVGLSMGYKSTPLALSGGFTHLGKIVMMGVMLRSRHRGLPLQADRAILLRGRDVEARDEIQESRARDATVYQQPDVTDQSNLFDRVNTATSRLRRASTLRRVRSHRPSHDTANTGINSLFDRV